MVNPPPGSIGTRELGLRIELGGTHGAPNSSLRVLESVAMRGFDSSSWYSRGQGPATLVELRTRAQLALGSLAMRRAVMNAIPLLVEDGSGANGSLASFSGLSSIAADPRQLLQLLKLAHLAVGGTGAIALFDGLRMLLLSLPPTMETLPQMLLADSLDHIARSTRTTVEVESPSHPLGNTLQLVQRLHIPGAASIRIEVDARSQLPVPELKPNTTFAGQRAALCISRDRTTSARRQNNVRKYTGAAADGGWMPVVVQGDTAFIEYTPQAPFSAANNSANAWGWRLRAAAETWPRLSDDVILREPLAIGWPVLHLLYDTVPQVLTSVTVFETMLIVLRHESSAHKESAVALLLRLLQLPSDVLSHDGRRDWGNLASSSR